MKLAVLSDIHGNVPALEAVLDDIRAWGPDRVIMNGDLVNRGPYSLECLRLIQGRLPGCIYIQGNHEVYVLACEADDMDPADPTRDLRRFAHWTYARLGEAVDEIRQWRDNLDLTDADGGAVHITHGSRLGNRAGVSASIPDDELAERLGEPSDLFIGSHTHKPMIRSYNDSLVVNTGSVGQPLDGDPRAAYGRFVYDGNAWTAEIARVAFDREQALRDLEESGFLDAGGPVTRLIHCELRDAQMHVGPWMREYLPRVKAGEISVAQGVDEYMRGLG